MASRDLFQPQLFCDSVKDKTHNINYIGVNKWTGISSYIFSTSVFNVIITLLYFLIICENVMLDFILIFKVIPWDYCIKMGGLTNIHNQHIYFSCMGYLDRSICSAPWGFQCFLGLGFFLSNCFVKGNVWLWFSKQNKEVITGRL